MVINENKSNCILIGTSQRIAKVTDHLSIHVNTLENVEFDKLLGVHIDSSLHFNKHVDVMCRSISAELAQLKLVHTPLNVLLRGF